MPDEQDQAEVLDDDKVVIETYPPDEPPGFGDLEQKDVLAIDEMGEDDLLDRVRREEPDVSPNRIIEDLADHDELLEPPIIDLVDDPDGPSDLVAIDVHDELEPWELADIEQADPADSLPAEEAAIHVIDLS